MYHHNNMCSADDARMQRQYSLGSTVQPALSGMSSTVISVTPEAPPTPTDLPPSYESIQEKADQSCGGSWSATEKTWCRLINVSSPAGPWIHVHVCLTQTWYTWHRPCLYLVLAQDYTFIGPHRKQIQLQIFWQIRKQDTGREKTQMSKNCFCSTC